ncbi:NERD domain-containing protein [Alkalihalobacterium elongatum]|uniref:NERD domain-containing protein n=1 Tax=Alkalihalobacterium elongatum TaxID=2675466 RepID=UPI001C1FB9AC|nr:NERD domain-containing protein [Alkalihalobacterium elongatum]
MAHLIKLEDYISRYQFDMQRYPTQFTRMKKERWYYIKNEWEQLKFPSSSTSIDDQVEPIPKGKQMNIVAATLQRLKGWNTFAFYKAKNIEEKQSDVPIDEKEEDRLAFKARSLEHLKELYLNDLFISQLMWASSSLIEQSYLNPKYKYDQHLRFFSQQIPDNYFLMYSPVFWIKQAPIDMDIIIITPSEVQCISILDGSQYSVFEASSDRFWVELIQKKERKVLSPIVSVNRMASIIKDILNESNCDFPIKRTVISQNSIIDYKGQGPKVEIIDKRTFTQWHERMKKHPSPIKSQQLKVAKILLDHCHTSAHVRQKIEDDQMS